MEDGSRGTHRGLHHLLQMPNPTTQEESVIMLLPNRMDTVGVRVINTPISRTGEVIPGCVTAGSCSYNIDYFGLWFGWFFWIPPYMMFTE